MSCSKELRIIIIGKTGTGKSKSANTILGRNSFKFGSSGSSITEKCQYDTANVFGYKIHIVDTPGLFDTRNKVDLKREIERCILLSSPGPHAILLTVQTGRFTEDDIKALNTFIGYFGEKLKDYVYILFTRYDDWKRDNAGSDNNFEKYIDSLPDFAKQFVTTQCRNKYIPFDNTLEGATSQVNLLLQKIDRMVLENGSTFYTDADYQLAALKIQERLVNERQNNSNFEPTPSIFEEICCALLGLGIAAFEFSRHPSGNNLQKPSPFPMRRFEHPTNKWLSFPNSVRYFDYIYSMAKNK